MSLFKEISASSDDPEPPTEIESLCMNCGNNGITKLLLLKIPFYREIILMSFCCESCGFNNNEYKSAGTIQDKGVRILLNVTQKEDLDRTLVKSEYTNIKIPEIDFEIPAQVGKADVTTVEGVLERCITGLEQDQPQRLVGNPDVAKKIQDVIEKLVEFKTLKSNFTMIIEDIGGNCFVSNPYLPQEDKSARVTFVIRTKEQDHQLGIFTKEDLSTGDDSEANKFTLEDLQSEVMQFPSYCPQCSSPCSVNMKMCDIPHFKQVVIMATNCESCDYRSNEVKSGGGIEPMALKIEVTISDPCDFNRDVLKSETCRILIPELDLDVGPATLSGRFTTVEGLLGNVKDQLTASGNMFGDSQDEKISERLSKFCNKLEDIITGKTPFTLILDDSAGNSFVQSLTPPEPDEKMKVIRYERTFDQNEELGLNDMKVENYENTDDTT